MKLNEMTAHELHRLLKKGEILAEEILNDVEDWIQTVEKEIKAFITLNLDAAREMAGEIDQKIKKGDKISPLTGIPVGVKDNICTRNLKTTCASRMTEDFVPTYNATVIDKCEENGVILAGKMNMDELAMGSSTENSYFYFTRNPWDLSLVPGGSSGGSAAAVAANEVIFALGSDTGGSIRQPAAFCGVVGMKPSFGYVSRYGLAGMAPSLEQIGPITKDVTDCAQVMNLICGDDPKDSATHGVEAMDFTSYLKRDIKGLKIGLPREYLSKAEPAVVSVVEEAAKQLFKLGAVCTEISLPYVEYDIECQYIISTVECGSSTLNRYDGVHFGYRAGADEIHAMYQKTRGTGFGKQAVLRSLLGTFLSSNENYDRYYQKALRVRNLIRRSLLEASQQVDVLLMPTSPVLPFSLGAEVDILKMWESDVFTVPANLAGIPAISIPGGFVKGLPVGIQFMGKPFEDGTVLRAAYAFEQATDYHLRKPDLGERG